MGVVPGGAVVDGLPDPPPRPSPTRGEGEERSAPDSCEEPEFREFRRFAWARSFLPLVRSANVMATDVADLTAMNKRSYPKPLAELVSVCVADVFARQGFTSCAIVTHWDDIVGPEIAAVAEPIRMQWVRSRDPDEAPPATLVLRVEGPAALEIQHMAGVILERVNRYLGWQAVDGLALRQAPLTRRRRVPRPTIDAGAAAAIAAQMTGIADESLRTALGRLGAAIKRT
jgi:hypothetical protein